MKRIIATILAMLMLVGTVSIPALAEENGNADVLPPANGDASLSDADMEDLSDETIEVDLPTATVTEIDTHTLATEEEVNLTYALNFKADNATAEQLDAYGDWYADFVLTVNKNVHLNANGEADGYLAGQYDEWSDSWVFVPFEDEEIVANEPLNIMETASEITGEAGLRYTYAEAYDVVKDFDCGVYFSDAFLKANPDLVTTLELRIYNPLDEEESYAIGKVYEFKVVSKTTEENIVVQGTKVTGNTVEIQDVNAESKADGTTSITIDTNEFIDNTEENVVVDTIKLPFTAIETAESLGDDATLNITLANGEADSDTTVSINKEALVAIKEAAEDAGASSLTLKVEQTEDLEPEQDGTVSNLDNAVVYKITLETEDGTPVYSSSDAQDGRKIQIKIPYTKVSTGRANIYVKHLKDDGTLENVSFTYSDNIITMNLAHFSEYVIYEKAVASNPPSSGGGSAIAKCTVRFDTDGGSSVTLQRINMYGKVSKPADPTKEGYIFDGWYTDNSFENPYDFEKAVAEDFTIYAKWVKNPNADSETKDDEDASSVWFEDVKESKWYYNDIKFVSDNKLMNGVSEKTFAPNALLTRAMLVTILYRNEGEPATNRSIPFADINMGAYYANAVIWAQQNAIVTGVSETEFAPDENITREQIATLLFRYAAIKGMDAVTLEENLESFKDADEISEFAVSALNWAVGNGIITGKTENTLCPRDNATRAEIAAILHRYLSLGK